MPISSINTNVGAYVALQNLNTVNLNLQKSQKQISTGYVVADALDNGAVFGVAQSVRSQITGAYAANQELGGFIGAVQTAAAAATGISNTLSDIRSVLTHISNPTLDKDSVDQYRVQYISLVEQMMNFLQSGDYNGTNLLSTPGSLPIIQDGNGTVLTVQGTQFIMNDALKGFLVGRAANPAAVPPILAASVANTTVALNFTNAASYLGAGGSFFSISASVSTVLNRIGTLNSRATLQQTFNQTVINSLSVGLGALVDADLAAESANLAALRTKQELSTQSLAIANTSPAIILKLFNN